MATALPCPTFNWKCCNPLCSWDQFQTKAELWLAGQKIDKEIQYTKIVLMLGDEGLSRWTKFKLSDDDKKKPTEVFKAFRDSLGTDVSFRTARATLYNNLRQQKGETAAELDIRLSKLIDECKFPKEDISKFLKLDIFINALNYYEVKKWAAKQKETGEDAITYIQVMDKCKEHEAAVRDYVAMASDNPQLHTAFQQGTANLDSNN